MKKAGSEEMRRRWRRLVGGQKRKKADVDFTAKQFPLDPRLNRYHSFPFRLYLFD